MFEIVIDKKAALDRFLALTAISGRSGQEADVAKAVVDGLLTAGVPRSQMVFDGAETRTRIEGNCGNLIVHLPGCGRGPVTMLTAHLDTVPICLGSQPTQQGDSITSAVETGLGADDRSGVAAILTAVIERVGGGEENYPPAVIGFLVQEEVGLEGARHLDPKVVGKVDRAFNFDGAALDKIVTGATGGERMEIVVRGIPSHAGVAPQDGVSAIVIAARAISELERDGWLGKVENESGAGTANVGVFHGGEATNVITPEVRLRAEARSHKASMRGEIVARIRGAFERSAASVTNAAGDSGVVEFHSHVDYEAFSVAETHESVVAAQAMLRRIGREPYCAVSNGGLDANWLSRHGIDAVTMGCGQRNIHTVDERLDIRDFHDACQIATWLITEQAG